MADGSSKILSDLSDSVYTNVLSAAISSDGQLVATGCLDGVRDLQPPAGTYFEHGPYRWYASGMFAPVNCWRGCRGTQVVCGV